MKIVVASINNPNLYPALHDLSVELQRVGHDVYFVSSVEPIDKKGVRWVGVPRLKRAVSRIPVLRTNYNCFFGLLRHHKPDMVVSHHQYTLAAIAYKVFCRPIYVAAYFSDYHRGVWYTEALNRVSPLIDLYIDICDLRVRWRSDDWPGMRARKIIIRQAPFLERNRSFDAHDGSPKMVITGSALLLETNSQRLSRFLQRLCERGVSIDWYLPASSDMRMRADSLLIHRLYNVRAPVSRLDLMSEISQYDVGLFWAPLADCDPTSAWDRSVFLSAASNKIGEYIAAGLVVAHTGNPGLSYLPGDVCAIFDPTDPEAGADQLATALWDRAEVERKRRAARQFHLDEMNFETQAAPFIRQIMEGRANGKA